MTLRAPTDNDSQLVGAQAFDLSGDIFGGDRTSVVRLMRFLEEDLNAKDAVWTQVVGNVVDLYVLWENELLAQLTLRHLVACDS